MSALERAVMASHDPMVYGHDDCAMWVAGILDEVHGTDLLPTLRNGYTDVRSAIRYWNQWESLVDALDAHVAGRFNRLPDGQPMQAYDVCVITTGKRQSVALPVSNSSIMARNTHGIIIMQRGQVQVNGVWRCHHPS